MYIEDWFPQTYLFLKGLLSYNFGRNIVVLPERKPRCRQLIFQRMIVHLFLFFQVTKTDVKSCGKKSFGCIGSKNLNSVFAFVTLSNFKTFVKKKKKIKDLEDRRRIWERKKLINQIRIKMPEFWHRKTRVVKSTV